MDSDKSTKAIDQFNYQNETFTKYDDSLIHRYNIAIQTVRKCQIKNFHARSQKNQNEKIKRKTKTAHTHICFHVHNDIWHQKLYIKKLKLNLSVSHC